MGELINSIGIQDVADTNGDRELSTENAKAVIQSATKWEANGSWET